MKFNHYIAYLPNEVIIEWDTPFFGQFFRLVRAFLANGENCVRFAVGTPENHTDIGTYYHDENRWVRA